MWFKHEAFKHEASSQIEICIFIFSFQTFRTAFILAKWTGTYLALFYSY